MANETFPYLTSLHVNDCYTYQDFDIPIGEGVDRPFRHLILTGKNGSGKTTVLRGIDGVLRNEGTTNPSAASGRVGFGISKKDWIGQVQPPVYAYFEEQRKTKVDDVKAPISEQEFAKLSLEQGLSKLLKQFLVNKKVNQAFATIANNTASAEQQGKFFEAVEQTFQEVFQEKKLKLEFSQPAYEFFVRYPDGRQATLNQLPAGYSALLGIILELLVRVDMEQGKRGDFTTSPPGLVLIDEPEAHLHLEMQYQVMPLLTSLFPNVQFIVATHSPAVASSIKDATVFDLTTKQVARDWVVGSSFSELMQTHFGLDNEFSGISDQIMAEAQRIVESSKAPLAKRAALRKLFEENERYLSPGFHLAMESTILQLEEELEPA
jgi:predicted ATP-binding protein involved in virulence